MNELPQRHEGTKKKNFVPSWPILLKEMKNLPRQTARIFEELSKGHFINANSNDAVQRELYTVVENHFDDLTPYFLQIGFELQAGDGYYYFSRQEEKADIERKVSAAYKWIDILDFFNTFNNGFAPGYRFYTSQLLEEVRVNGLLRNKLEELSGRSDNKPAREKIDSLLKKMLREGFIEKIDEHDDAYKVTAALHYLEQLILAIEVPEEEEG